MSIEYGRDWQMNPFTYKKYEKEIVCGSAPAFKIFFREVELKDFGIRSEEEMVIFIGWLNFAYRKGFNKL